MLDDDHRQSPFATLVKAHPRGRAAFVNGLSAHLSKFFIHVIVLAQYIALMPVEVLLTCAFQTGKVVVQRCRIFATSTAAYFIPIIFGLPVTLGYGESTCRRLYRHAGWCSVLLRHERVMWANLESLLKSQTTMESTRS